MFRRANLTPGAGVSASKVDRLNVGVMRCLLLVLSRRWGMLTVETIGRIRREHFLKGKTIKEIARDLRVSRNTIRKVLRLGKTSFDYERSVQPQPKLGRWTALTTSPSPRPPTSNGSQRGSRREDLMQVAGSVTAPADSARLRLSPNYLTASPFLPWSAGFSYWAQIRS